MPTLVPMLFAWLLLYKVYTVYMNNTKLFSFRLKDELKVRLEKKIKFGVTLTHLINRAIELQLDRDDKTDEGIKANEALYGPSNPPEDLGEFVK